MMGLPPLCMSCRCMRRRRARCSLRGCPRSGAVRSNAAARRARAGGAPLQVQASAVVQERGRRRWLRNRPRLFSAAPCKQIECENGDGFWRPSAFDGCPSRAGALGGGLSFALEPVYARAAIIPSAATRGSSGIAASRIDNVAASLHLVFSESFARETLGFRAIP